MSNESKFKLWEHVRVTNPEPSVFDKVGRITGSPDQGGFYRVIIDGYTYWIKGEGLILADPDVHAILDQMDAESAAAPVMPTDQMPWASVAVKADDGEKSEGAIERTGVTAEDKLRMIADTVEGQVPFGTELANFRRRLSAILSIGHDA
ncbi:hypothetical protein [Arthrobacter sp. GMC3]|uniref:hypothetical protein n=1 Tax=Arthrobacter sp. GMC3 TaxID=2058894 RepID=UPI000CE301E0|nr:hypothetical protein [Arthrobacter sp. GMC3]